MKKLWTVLWIIIGRILYVLVWPLLYLYLRLGGERTRVVVTYKDNILLVQNWLGTGQWMLPGGGVYRHERPTNSAVRELKEETGLKVRPHDLKFIGNANYKGKGLNIALVCYHLKLTIKPKLKIRRQLEVMNIKWVSLGRALTKESITPDTRQMLELWNKHGGFEAAS